MNHKEMAGSDCLPARYYLSICLEELQKIMKNSSVEFKSNFA
jgi:hypothetical protein